MTTFEMFTIESWTSRDGEIKTHRNIVTVEVLGRDSQMAFDRLHPGSHVAVDGYIRSAQLGGRTVMTVRVYNIEFGESVSKEEDTEEKHEVEFGGNDTSREKA